MAWRSVVRIMLAGMLATWSLGTATAAAPARIGSAVRVAASDTCPDHVAARHGVLRDKVYLEGVAALSARSVWAVGAVDTAAGGLDLPFIEHYDGKVWCAADTHNWRGGPLYAVAAVSAGDIWAVGEQIEHWDGHAWTVVPHPATPPGLDALTSVSASSAGNVWAAGNGMVERWDGSTWHGIPLPITPDLASSRLGSIATLSFTDTWLVGTAALEGTRNGAWALHWNGRQWRQTPLPRVPASTGPGVQVRCTGDDPVFFGNSPLAVIGSGNVWAVGYAIAQHGGAAGSVCAVAYHWDGKTWHGIWPAAGFSDAKVLATYGMDMLGVHAVVAAGPNDIWAMGHPEAPSLHWDGRRWHVIQSFSGPFMIRDFALMAMSAAGSTDIWAVAAGLPSPWNAYHWDGHVWRGLAALPAG